MGDNGSEKGSMANLVWNMHGLVQTHCHKACSRTLSMKELVDRDLGNRRAAFSENLYLGEGKGEKRK